MGFNPDDIVGLATDDNSDVAYSEQQDSGRCVENRQKVGKRRNGGQIRKLAKIQTKDDRSLGQSDFGGSSFPESVLKAESTEVADRLNAGFKRRIESLPVFLSFPRKLVTRAVKLVLLRTDT